MNMSSKYIFYLTFLLSIIMLTGCHNDSDFEEETSSVTETDLTIPINFVEVTGDIIGYVFDASNTPIQGAEISIYSGSTITDEYGVFRFYDQKLDRQGTYVIVEKTGYKKGYNRIYPDGSTNFAKVVMNQLTDENSFNTNSDFEVIKDGFQVNVESDALVLNGSSYNGVVLDNSQYTSTTDYKLAHSSSGFIGMTNDGKTQVLALQGIFDFKLTNGEFEELNFVDNTKFSAKFDALGGISTPSELGLWKFDDLAGIWKERGIAIQDGGAYEAEIDDTGLWAIGISYDLAQVKGDVQLNGIEGANLLCRVLANGVPCYIGYTDNEGVLSAKVPSDVQLEIEVLEEYCDQSMFIDDFGPFDDLDFFDVIEITKENQTINGKVKCDDLNISNVLIKLDVGEFTTFFTSSKEGDFSIDQDILDCPSGTKMITAIVEPVDNRMTVSEDVSTWVSTESYTLNICFSCELSATIQYEKVDLCSNGAYDIFEVQPLGGSGSYSYSWSNGENTKSISNALTQGEYCATVTDNEDGCVYTVCEEIKSYEAFNIDNAEIGNTGCASDGGFIALNESGGQGPFIYFWDGPDGTAPSGNRIEDLLPGEYTITAEDANGCVLNETFVIYNVNTPLDFLITYICDESIISVDPINPGSFQVDWSGGVQNGNDVSAFEPGEYCVVVTDEFGCERQGCVTLSSVGLDKPELIKEDCDEELVYFNNTGGTLEITYDNIELGGVSNGVSNGDRIEVPVFESGYNFNVSMTHLISGCTDNMLVQLPEFRGLGNVDVSDTSCGGCEDGFVTWTIDESADCLDCEFNEVLFIEANSGNDFYDLNAEQMLPNGTYYIVVTSTDGCYIAHQKVQVQ